MVTKEVISQMQGRHPSEAFSGSLCGRVRERAVGVPHAAQPQHEAGVLLGPAALQVCSGSSVYVADLQDLDLYFLQVCVSWKSTNDRRRARQCGDVGYPMAEGGWSGW